MSASREKKQRQTSEEPAISSRAQEEMEKEARRKRNTKIYAVIGAVVVILAAILLIWNSGIFQRNTTVAEIDGEKVTAAQVAYYYYNNKILQTAQVYNSYGMADYISYSLSESPKDQVITESAIAEFGLDESYVGKTYHDYFLDDALSSLRQVYALCAAAEDAGYTLSDEGKETVNEALENIDSNREVYLTTYGANLSRTKYLQLIYGSTMTEKAYTTCLENSQLASEFYTDNFNTLADYSAEELDAYYQENKDSMDTVSYFYRYFDGTAEKTTDADGNTVEPTDEETAAAMAEAQKLANSDLELILADPDYVRDNEDYTETSGQLSTDSLYYDWLMDGERQKNDVTVLESSYGYYVLFFDERFLDETPTVNVRHILIEAKNEDDPATEDVDESTQDPTDEVYAAAEQKAQELLDQWKAGEATEESFAALAEEYSVDPGSNTNGGLYKQVAPGDMIEAFNDWIFADERQSGDTGLVQNTVNDTKGWHVLYYVGQDEPVWMITARQAIWANDLENNVEIVRTDKLDLVLD